MHSISTINGRTYEIYWSLVINQFHERLTQNLVWDSTQVLLSLVETKKWNHMTECKYGLLPPQLTWAVEGSPSGHAETMRLYRSGVVLTPRQSSECAG